jgi:hypothetical protein
MAAFDTVAGRIAWHDLLTADMPAARTFYTRLFGWTTRRVDLGPAGRYTVVRSGDCDLGGIVTVGRGPVDRTHWVPHIGIDNLAAALEAVNRSGGRLRAKATDHPMGGRCAVIRDPQGVSVSLIDAHGGAAGRSEAAIPGRFCWDELLVSDTTGMVEFYRDLAGWTATAWDLGELGTYWVFRRGDRDVAGMTSPPGASGLPSGWLPYIQVVSPEDTAAMAEELGGRLVTPPGDVPGRGRSAIVRDPAGGLVGLYALTAAA